MTQIKERRDEEDTEGEAEWWGGWQLEGANVAAAGRAGGLGGWGGGDVTSARGVQQSAGEENQGSAAKTTKAPINRGRSIYAQATQNWIYSAPAWGHCEAFPSFSNDCWVPTGEFFVVVFLKKERKRIFVCHITLF